MTTHANETIHYLELGAKRSLSDMPPDEGFKIRAQMIEVSQSSHVVCRHTAFVSVDQETLEPLPSPIQVGFDIMSLNVCNFCYDLFTFCLKTR